MKRIIEKLKLVVAAMVLAVGGVLGSTSAVFADQTLCSGAAFSTCTSAGYTAHGYENHYMDNVGGVGIGYWRTINGHNCTNYVGYMLTQNGSSGPGVPMGNANQWDNTIASNPAWGYTINQNAAVGSIALWENANMGTGHIAYVESVSANGIVVSEDNYASGPFRWRTIAPNGDWPDKFLHIADVTAAPNPGPAPYPGVGSAVFKGSATLTAGQTLGSNQYITSDNGQSVLVMQTDGNLVLYRGSSAARWQSGTGGHPGAYLAVQTDGNVVVYSATNVPLWWSGTTNVSTFTLQTDGNLVGYPTSGAAVWQSGTSGAESLTYLGTDHLSPGGQIHPNQYIRSADGRYFLMAQTDGNVVVYSPGYHVLWKTNTGGNPGGSYITLQTDGNIVVYSATGAPLWWTGTPSVTTLTLQNDGNLVGYPTSGSAQWWTGTGGMI